MKVYSVYDQAAQAFMPPMCFRTDGEATRAFAMACVDPTHSFNKAASDYTLFYIGEFSEHSGLLEACVPSKLVAKGSAIAEQHSSST